MNSTESESVRKAMELAWRDHHHARDQTWKTIQVVAVIAGGLVALDYKYEESVPTLLAASLTIVSALFGILITWNHRKLERRKFIHIMNCEEYLGLHQSFLIPLHSNEKLVGMRDREKDNGKDKVLQKLIDDSAVKVPATFSYLHIINPFKNNTALFILRMHVAIILFSLLVLVLRINESGWN